MQAIGQVAQGYRALKSCVVEWAHSGLSDSFFFSLPMESQDILGWRGHHKIIGSTHLLKAGPT